MVVFHVKKGESHSLPLLAAQKIASAFADTVGAPYVYRTFTSPVSFWKASTEDTWYTCECTCGSLLSDSNYQMLVDKARNVVRLSRQTIRETAAALAEQKRS